MNTKKAPYTLKLTYKQMHLVANLVHNDRAQQQAAYPGRKSANHLTILRKIGREFKDKA